jgi:AraC-like DNA-binding protein
LRAQDADFMRRLRHLITTGLHTGVPELSSVAEQMGLSARTLQRRMNEHDIVFSDLVDNIRKGIAFEYVRETDYRLIDIAHILGYQEASSFTRAFKRWADETPRQMRRAAQQERAVGSGKV